MASGPAATAAVVAAAGTRRRLRTSGTATAAAIASPAPTRTTPRWRAPERCEGRADSTERASISRLMKRFSGATVAVTGAAGFIGSRLTAELVGEGAEVVGIDVSPTAAERILEAGGRPRICDITEPASVSAAIAGSTHVIHTAAFVHEWGTMDEFVHVNVRGTAAVLDAAQSAGVERVVHTSSVVVYGYDHPGEQDEDAHLRTAGIPYIDTKAASDRLARRRGAVVIRPGDVYGPGSVPWFVRPLQLARAGQLSVPGSGAGVMLPVYVDDLVEALLVGVERGAPGRAYTAWDGDPVTFREYFGRIAAIAGTPEPRRLPRPVLEVAGGLSELWARLRSRPPAFTSRSPVFIDRRGTISNRRIREELGWQPLVGLDEGLKRARDWALAEGLLS